MTGRNVATSSGGVDYADLLTNGAATDPDLHHDVPVASADAINADVEAIQSELETLREEVSLLRRRDDMLKVTMGRIDEELRLAARLQRDFLPKQLPTLGPIRFHAVWRPAGYVSGDLYDVMRLDERNIGLYIADAVGHGIPAALLTMFIRNALATKEIRNNSYRLLEPSETMDVLNTALAAQQLSHASFATSLYGRVDIDTLEFVFARSGHPSPVLIRDGQVIDDFEAEGGLLGIFPDQSFEDRRIQLQSGDRLMLFTDGVEVCFSKDQTLDIDQWRSEIDQRTHLSASEMLSDLMDHLDNEVGSLSPRDDLTMIIAEVD